jgi:hypothetical protein
MVMKLTLLILLSLFVYDDLRAQEAYTPSVRVVVLRKVTKDEVGRVIQSTVAWIMEGGDRC